MTAPDRVTLRITRTVTGVIETTWPDDYTDMSLEEAVSWEKGDGADSMSASEFFDLVDLDTSVTDVVDVQAL